MVGGGVPSAPPRVFDAKCAKAWGIFSRRDAELAERFEIAPSGLRVGGVFNHGTHGSRFAAHGRYGGAHPRPVNGAEGTPPPTNGARVGYVSVECEAIGRSVSVALCCSSEFIKKPSGVHKENIVVVPGRAPNRLGAGRDTCASCEIAV